jgi:hypothetical protein
LDAETFGLLFDAAGERSEIPQQAIVSPTSRLLLGCFLARDT